MRGGVDSDGLGGGSARESGGSWRYRPVGRDRSGRFLGSGNLAMVDSLKGIADSLPPEEIFGPPGIGKKRLWTPIRRLSRRLRYFACSAVGSISPPSYPMWQCGRAAASLAIPSLLIFVPWISRVVRPWNFANVSV